MQVIMEEALVWEYKYRWVVGRVGVLAVAFRVKVGVVQVS